VFFFFFFEDNVFLNYSKSSLTTIFSSNDTNLFCAARVAYLIFRDWTPISTVHASNSTLISLTEPEMMAVNALS